LVLAFSPCDEEANLHFPLIEGGICCDYPEMKQVSRATSVIVLTVFSAGLVDVLSFAKLGAIFTSAMTGNLALLGFYAATGAMHSAIKSLSALAGFIAGCALGTILGRGKTSRVAVSRTLGLEALLIAVCAIGSMQTSLSVRSDFVQAEIVLLALAMGLQSVVGTELKQTNVVFTTTLIKIVSAVIGSTREQSSIDERRRNTAVVVAYLIGASIAGVTIATHFAAALIIPVIAIGVALAFARGVE
jgi:uncharacterized membrane protein YoaK (UPF0700 family)